LIPLSEKQIGEFLGSCLSPPNTVGKRSPTTLTEARPAAALAFHHLVALLEQALALAVLALPLLLDVGAFFIGHDILPAVISRSGL
jgi:hypothetical protein